MILRRKWKQELLVLISSKNTKFSWVELICQICWLNFIDLNYSEKMLIPKDNFSLLKQIPGCCTANCALPGKLEKTHFVAKIFLPNCHDFTTKRMNPGKHLDDRQRKRAFNASSWQNSFNPDQLMVFGLMDMFISQKLMILVVIVNGVVWSI